MQSQDEPSRQQLTFQLSAAQRQASVRDSAELHLPVSTKVSVHIAQPATSTGVFPQQRLRRPESDHWNSLLSKCISHIAVDLTVALADNTRR